MSNITKSSFFLSLCLFSFIPLDSRAQQTNNSSTLNNSAAPSASSITSGGTNVNYQTNNSFNNENGFGPGIFCRTPSLYVGGNWGNTNQNNIDISNNSSSNNNQSYSANIGVVVPFGSSILRECADLSHQLTLDRKISTDLSLIRACNQLDKEGITVDPEKFPYLEKCSKSISSNQRTTGSINPMGNTRIPGVPQLAPKVPKVTKS